MHVNAFHPSQGLRIPSRPSIRKKTWKEGLIEDQKYNDSKHTESACILAGTLVLQFNIKSHLVLATVFE